MHLRLSLNTKFNRFSCAFFVTACSFYNSVKQKYSTVSLRLIDVIGFLAHHIKIQKSLHVTREIFCKYVCHQRFLCILGGISFFSYIKKKNKFSAFYYNFYLKAADFYFILSNAILTSSPRGNNIYATFQ